MNYLVCNLNPFTMNQTVMLYNAATNSSTVVGNAHFGDMAQVLGAMANTYSINTINLYGPQEMLESLAEEIHCQYSNLQININNLGE